jgi:hypothetical protein
VASTTDTASALAQRQQQQQPSGPITLSPPQQQLSPEELAAAQREDEEFERRLGFRTTADRGATVHARLRARARLAEGHRGAPGQTTSASSSSVSASSRK